MSRNKYHAMIEWALGNLPEIPAYPTERRTDDGAPAAQQADRSDAALRARLVHGTALVQLKH
jgi:hypothetical protein